LGTLLASVAVATLLALVGMMLVLAGPLREPKIQADLEAQGLGPSALRRELRLRFSLACLLGIWPGLLIALLLDRMTVAAVGAYENGGSQLPLVTVIPVRQLLAVGLGLTALCLVGGWAVSGIPLPRRRPKRPPQRPFGPAALDELLRNPLP
jgi:hypothetical protein